jgi:hypothetical protein|tara:strand:- start:263 stop:397 length:135 start_codon:yes stop_codon:yes gene_type:complete
MVEQEALRLHTLQEVVEVVEELPLQEVQVVHQQEELVEQELLII